MNNNHENTIGESFIKYTKYYNKDYSISYPNYIYKNFKIIFHIDIFKKKKMHHHFVSFHKKTTNNFIIIKYYPKKSKEFHITYRKKILEETINKIKTGIDNSEFNEKFSYIYLFYT
tara:strand:+ start:17833 stop:18180 length:348 start_codon:yes stop_codon:yes gene_type:complete